MRYAAPEGEMFRPFQPEETRGIHIGQVCTDNQRGHCEAGLFLQPRLPDQRADE